MESNMVLSFVASESEEISFLIEKSKKKTDKIHIPVLHGRNGEVILAFEVDGYSEDFQTVIEVEAGHAVTNFQFLKDFYEACMMQGVQYFCIAVKKFIEHQMISKRFVIFFKHYT